MLDLASWASVSIFCISVFINGAGIYVGFGYGDIGNILEPARPDVEGIFPISLPVGSKSLPSPIPSRGIPHGESGFGSPLPSWVESGSRS